MLGQTNWPRNLLTLFHEDFGDRFTLLYYRPEIIPDVSGITLHAPVGLNNTMEGVRYVCFFDEFTQIMVFKFVRTNWKVVELVEQEMT